MKIKDGWICLLSKDGQRHNRIVERMMGDSGGFWYIVYNGIAVLNQIADTFFDSKSWKIVNRFL